MNYKRTVSNYLGYRTDPTKVAVALLAGMALGAIAGILFAPESGEDIRYRLSDKAKSLANDAKDKFQSVKERFQPDIDRLAEATDEAVNTVKSKAQNASAQTQDYVSNAVETTKSKAKNVSIDQNGSIQGI